MITYSSSLDSFCRKNHEDVKKLLSKYGRSLIFCTKDLNDLCQNFYVMLLNRKIVESFDTSVTNVDKVFTSYICACIKTFCFEERRRAAKDALRLSRHLPSDLAGKSTGESQSVFEAVRVGPASCSGGRAGRGQFTGSPQAVGDCMHPNWASNGDDIFSDFLKALNTDGDLSESDREGISTIVSLASHGEQPGEIARTLGCRPSRVSLLRKRAAERFAWYREAGYV